MKQYREITADDVGKIHIKAFGQVWEGRIFPQDVGKRIYLSGDVLQVENDEQRNIRRARELNVETKEDAMAFVFAVMSSPRALRSPDFQVAMHLSERFRILAKDLLELRQDRASK